MERQNTHSVEEIETDRGALLERLMFGWILDGLHGNEAPVFAISGDEYVDRMRALADAEADTEA